MTSAERNLMNGGVAPPKWLETTGPTEVPGVMDSELDETEPLLSVEVKPRLWSPPIRKYVPIEVVVSGYLFCVVLCLPLVEFYLYEKVAEQYGGVNRTTSIPCSPVADNSSDAKLAEKVQAETTNYVTFLIFTSSFPGVIQTFALGAISDKHGRRGSLFLALCGLLVRDIIYLIVFQLDLPLGYLFIGNFLDGLTGSFGTVLTAVFGMVADITAGGHKRAFRIAIVQAVMAFASALGMFVAGVWIDAAGFKQPLYFITALTGATLLFAIFVLPETRRNQSKEPISIKEHLKSMKRSFQVYTIDTADKRRWKLIVSLITFLTTFSVDLTLATILILYLLATPFCWQRTNITAYTATRTVVNWVCILLVARTCGRYISEINIAIIACISNFLFLLLIGLGYSNAMIYTAAVLGILSQAAPPMMRSVMSRLVSPDEQGALFASVSAVEVLATAVLGVVMTMVYKASLSFFPGLIFLILAFFTLLTAVLLGTLSYGIRKDNARNSQTITVDASDQVDVRQSLPDE